MIGRNEIDGNPDDTFADPEHFVRSVLHSWASGTNAGATFVIGTTLLCGSGIDLELSGVSVRLAAKTLATVCTEHELQPNTILVVIFSLSQYLTT